jgi:hypothetical protein
VPTWHPRLRRLKRFKNREQAPFNGYHPEKCFWDIQQQEVGSSDSDFFLKYVKGHIPRDKFVT